MPSRAEMRVRGEWALRSLVIAALLGMLWQTLRPAGGSTAASINRRQLGGNVLTTWSEMPIAPGSIHLQLDSTPSPVERAWLGALSGAGTEVTWSGDLGPLMIGASPIATPGGGTKVSVSGAGGSPVVLSDEIGAIDTIRAQGLGASVALKRPGSRLVARAKGAIASTAQTDSVTLRKVMVIGSAGWESKFVVAALEEEGWKVDAFIRVAPSVDVTQGSGAAIDTSRYSAVVALDSAASPYAARITEFVRAGGGLVLEPGAAVLEGMSTLRAGNAGNVLSSTGSREAGESVTETSLRLRPITSLRADAIPRENRNGSISPAARRARAGRVLQTGYDETWRWRMDGGDDGLRDHRQWWSGLLSQVVYAPEAPRAPKIAGAAAITADESPLSGLIASIGPAAPRNSASLSANKGNRMAALFAVMILALLTEVASRRSRGAS